MQKRIKNLPYLIDEQGNVFSIKSNTWLKPTKKDNGYLQFKLFVSYNPENKKRKYEYLYAHRLVAEYFIDNPNNYPCINHIDGNKENNNVSNLEWCTYAQNMQHAVKTGLFKIPNKITELENIFNDFISGNYLLSELEDKYDWHSGSRITSIYLKDYAKQIGKEEEYKKAKKMQLHLKAMKSGKSTQKAVIQLSLSGEILNTYESTNVAAKTLGISQGCISNVCIGRSKTAGGFIWKFQ